MVNKIPRSVQLALLALTLAAGAAWGYRLLRPSAESGSAVVRVERGDIESRFVDAGEITPKVGVDVASKVSGRVTQMLVEEGQSVRKGERLCVIQPGRTESEQYQSAAVFAPIGGVVMRYQKAGNYTEDGRIVRLNDHVVGLSESSEPTYLMTVADLSRMIVKMKISEMDVLKLSQGMSVTVTVDALPGESFPAKITLISPQAEKDANNLKNFKVVVSLLKTDARLKPGMTARVDGLLASRRQALKLPLSAVFEEDGKEFAYVSQAAGPPRRVALKLGLRSETDAEVLQGPSLGERLLTEKPASPAP